MSGTLGLVKPLHPSSTSLASDDAGLIEGLANRRLQASQIALIAFVGGRLAPLDVSFGRQPFPVIDVAIGKREVATLAMAVGGQVPPHFAEFHARWRNAEMRVGDAVFVMVQKHKNLARRRT